MAASGDTGKREPQAGYVERPGLERLGFARAAVIAGALLFAGAVLVTAVLPTGAAYLRLYLLASRALPHLLMAAFWAPAVLVLFAVVAVIAFGPVATVRWARWAFAAAAALIVAGGVYALRILHFADQRLFRTDVYGPGLDLGRLLTDVPSWIAWMAVLVAGGFCVAALLVVGAVRVRPGEVRSVPWVADAGARRVVAVAGLVALITVVLLLLHEHAWHSVLAARSAHAGLGGRAWIAAVLFALGQFGWVAVALVSAAAARRPWHAWIAWAVAGGWGALLALKGLLHMLMTWSPSRLLGLILQTGSRPSGGPSGCSRCTGRTRWRRDSCRVSSWYAPSHSSWPAYASGVCWPASQRTRAIVRRPGTPRCAAGWPSSSSARRSSSPAPRP